MNGDYDPIPLGKLFMYALSRHSARVLAEYDVSGAIRKVENV